MVESPGSVSPVAQCGSSNRDWDCLGSGSFPLTHTLFDHSWLVDDGYHEWTMNISIYPEVVISI
eukprot:scaffold1605_cov141-Cylindrotheca_fusiformis.AAC.12